MNVDGAWDTKRNVGVGGLGSSFAIPLDPQPNWSRIHQIVEDTKAYLSTITEITLFTFADMPVVRHTA